jgi:tetratricopeptide (TPR) repeat protein
LHRPVDEFLETTSPNSSIDGAPDQIEDLLRTGQAEQAERRLLQLLAAGPVPIGLRIRLKALLAGALLQLHRPQEAKDILEETVGEASKGPFRHLLPDLYDRMGSVHYLLRDAASAAEWWERALAAYQEAHLQEPLLLAGILGHRAALDYVRGRYRESLSQYGEALRVAGNILDLEQVASIYEGMALSHERLGEFTAALDEADRSLRLFDTLGNVRRAARVRNNIGGILLLLGRASEARLAYERGAEDMRRVGEHNLLPHLLAGQAGAALAEADLVRARNFVTQAEAACQDSSDPLARLATERAAGRVRLALGSGDEALGHFERALALADQMGSPMERSRVAFDLAEALASGGYSQSALKLYRRALNS